MWGWSSMKPGNNSTMWRANRYVYCLQQLCHQWVQLVKTWHSNWNCTIENHNAIKMLSSFEGSGPLPFYFSISALLPDCGFHQRFPLRRQQLAKVQCPDTAWSWPQPGALPGGRKVFPHPEHRFKELSCKHVQLNEVWEMNSFCINSSNHGKKITSS